MDLLGFIVVAVVLGTQWPVVKAAFAVLPRLMHAGADAFGDACIMLKSSLIKIQFWIAIAALVFQLAFLFLSRSLSAVTFWQLPVWYMVVLGVSTLVMVLQLKLAGWNHIFGAAHIKPLELTDRERELGLEPKRVIRIDKFPENNDPRSLSNKTFPFAWMFLVGTTFLLEGVATQWHALLNEPYFQAQWLIAAGFVCKLWYGLFALLVAAVISIVVRKGTRSIEVLSNIAAKLGLVWLPKITWENVEVEMGGKFDLWDEDYIASLVDTMLLMAFLPFLPYDAAIFTVPHPIVAIITAAVIAVAGASVWAFMRTDDLAKREGQEYLKRSKRLFFLLAPAWVVVATLVGAVWHATDEGQSFSAWVENFRYGLVFITHYGVIGYALIAGVAMAIFFTIRVANKYLADKCFTPAPVSTDADSKTLHAFGEKHGLETPLRWLSYVFTVTRAVAATCAIVCLSMAVSSCMRDTVRMRDPLQVGKRSDLVLGTITNGPVISPETRELDFCTQKKAVGIVEFMDPKLAQFTGLPTYIYLTSEQDKAKCEGGYRHTAKIPESCLGPLPYRVVMRNDERVERAYWSPKGDSTYGSLTVFEAQKKTFPSASSRFGFWEKMGADFWFVSDPACRQLNKAETVDAGGTSGSGSGTSGGSKTGGAVTIGSAGTKGVVASGQNAKTLPDLVVDPEFQELYGR